MKHSNIKEELKKRKAERRNENFGNALVVALVVFTVLYMTAHIAYYFINIR